MSEANTEKAILVAVAQPANDEPSLPAGALKKFLEIRNIGRFKQSKAKDDVEFKKLTLIFSENGYGKTTFCAIMRSLQSGEAAPIMGRKTLGATGLPFVHLLQHGQPSPIKFDNQVWSQTLPHVEVFDQTFVTENVYFGDGVGTEQRRGLYRVIVGKVGVTLAMQLGTLGDEIKAIQTDIKQTTKTIESHTKGIIKADDLIDSPQDHQIDTAIAEAEANVGTVKEAALIKVKEGLKKVSLPITDYAVPTHLVKTLSEVSAEAEATIKEHMAKHAMPKEGRAWIQTGLAYHSESNCPFCDHSTDGIALVKAYQEYFSQEYADFKNDLIELGKKIAAELSDAIIADQRSTLVTNNNASDFWQKHCAKATPPDASTLNELDTTAAKYREALLAPMREKAASPLEVVTIGVEYDIAVKTYEALVQIVAKYNSQVDAYNALIEARRKEIESSDIKEAQDTLDRLKLKKSRHSGVLKEHCDKIVHCRVAEAKKKDEKDKVKEELDKYENTVKRYEVAINSYLDSFGANFTLCDTKPNYVGGINVNYQILINNHKVPLVENGNTSDQPCFANTLSSGDRSVLALAFFLAQQEMDSEVAKKVLCFDDPFSSQDEFRRTQTALEIIKIGRKCAQVVVLSHDPYFLETVHDANHAHPCKALKFTPIGRDQTIISIFDVKGYVASEYRKQITLLQSYYDQNGGNPNNVIQKLRPVLERYCRDSAPTQFDETDTLGEILGKISKEGNEHFLYPIYDDLNAINEYTQKHHHGDGTVVGVVSEAELRTFVKKTLKLIKAVN